MLSVLAVSPLVAAGAEEGDRSEGIVRLESTAPLAGDAEPVASDLEALADWLGGATVVGLGESVHGADTLHRLGERIFRHLVREEGFTVFAWEVDQAHAALLDEYVQGERDDLAAILASRWWAQRIFYDRALADLLGWMRHYNRTATEPLHFAGYDAKQPRLTADRLLERLSELAPDDEAALGALYEQALEVGGFGVFPNVWGFTGTLEIELGPLAVPSRLRVEATVWGEGVSRGTVGLSARGATPAIQGWASVPAEELGAAAVPLEIELEIPPGPQTVRLDLFHRGNGRVEIGAPRITRNGEPLGAEASLEALEVRPLGMPALQSMDYTYRLVADPATGEQAVVIEADPALDRALEAARRAEGLVAEVLARRESEIGSRDRQWLLQLARLITQAVEWRVLAEPNRDVFLAENLHWLRQTAFPGARILALGHTSHTERRPGRMGRLLADLLGTDYRTISMIARSGEFLYFGEENELTPESPLERHPVDLEWATAVDRALAELAPGSFLVRLGDADDGTGSRAWLARHGGDLVSAPDAAIVVEEVEPMEAPPEP